MKILEISAKLNIGGAQAVAANIAKYADKSMQFCYIVFGDEIGEYEADIIRKGNTVLHMSEPKENVWKFFWEIVRLMKKEKFDVVHSHTMFNCGLIMLAGWIAGVPGRISHSHTTNDESDKTFIRRFYLVVMRFLIKNCGTDWCACGVDAGSVLYGKKWFSEHGTVIRNGIDVSKYQYDAVKREKIRNQYQLSNRFVIGHVGHYVKVKNQSFLIRLMGTISRKMPGAILLLFGDGPDRLKLSDQIKKMRLNENVYLMGNVDNISDILSAVDVFVFPSLYEGTPLALIEAQANGLPCVISDSIPDDVSLTGNMIKLSLDQSIEVWEQAVLEAKRGDSIEAANCIKQKYGTIEMTMEVLYSIFRKYSRNEVE